MLSFKEFRTQNKWLNTYLLLSVGGMLLLSVRFFIQTDKLLLFLLWNLFLALVPLLVSKILLMSHLQRNSVWIHVILGIVWLIFLPNSPYILTDFVHVVYGNRSLLLLDLFTWFYFSLVAFSAGLLSLNTVSDILSSYYKKYMVGFIILVFCLLAGLGIYIGRDLRFNSWDVLMKPEVLLSESSSRLLHPAQDMNTLRDAFKISMLLYATFLFSMIFRRTNS